MPVEIYRDGKKPMTLSVKVEALDLAEEQEQAAGDELAPNRQRAPRNEPKDTDFGMQLREITPAIARAAEPARRHAAAPVISAMDPVAVRPPGAGLSPGDVILSRRRRRRCRASIR